MSESSTRKEYNLKSSNPCAEKSYACSETDLKLRDMQRPDGSLVPTGLMVLNNLLSSSPPWVLVADQFTVDTNYANERAEDPPVNLRRLVYSRTLPPEEQAKCIFVLAKWDYVLSETGRKSEVSEGNARRAVRPAVNNPLEAVMRKRLADIEAIRKNILEDLND